MSGSKCNISLIVVLVSLFSFQAFSQQMNIGNSLTEDNPSKAILIPGIHYMIGSNFIAVPHLGSVTSVTVSPSISIPLSPKLSVYGGIMAGYFYSSPWNSTHEGAVYGSFNELSVYGSASYRFNPQLTLYGSAVKQLASTSPFYTLPKSSYTIGSAYDFGSFSIGVSFQMSKWDNIYSPFPINGSQGFYSPFEQGRVLH
jgi:hypothetical protein